jgi:uncharacterized membrane protein
MAKLSLFATVLFVGYGWVSSQTGVIYTGMAFLIAFFGFFYAKRYLTRVQHERTFHGSLVPEQQAEPVAGLKPPGGE